MKKIYDLRLPYLVDNFSYLQVSRPKNFINSFKRDFPNLYPRQYDDQQDFSAYGDIHEEN